MSADFNDVKINKILFFFFIQNIESFNFQLQPDFILNLNHFEILLGVK